MSEVYDSDIAHSQRFNLQWVNKRIKDYRYREKEWSVGRGDLGIKRVVSDAKLLSFSNQIRVKIEVVSSPVWRDNKMTFAFPLTPMSLTSWHFAGTNAFEDATVYQCKESKANWKTRTRVDHVAATTEILIMIQEETILLWRFSKQKPELRCGVTRSSCCKIKISKKRLLWPRKRDSAYFFY